MAKNDERVTAKELRNRNASELESLRATKTEELAGARFKQALGQQQKTHEIRALRRDIARLNTIMSEKNAARSSK